MPKTWSTSYLKVGPSSSHRVPRKECSTVVPAEVDASETAVMEGGRTQEAGMSECSAGMRAHILRDAARWA
eukprot:scaffold275264_cov39-Tisochrysis_lutea.AAC.4